MVILSLLGASCKWVWPGLPQLTGRVFLIVDPIGLNYSQLPSLQIPAATCLRELVFVATPSTEIVCSLRLTIPVAWPSDSSPTFTFVDNKGRWHRRNRLQTKDGGRRIRCWRLSLGRFPGFRWCYQWISVVGRAMGWYPILLKFVNVTSLWLDLASPGASGGDQGWLGSHGEDLLGCLRRRPTTVLWWSWRRSARQLSTMVEGYTETFPLGSPNGRL